jgi:hypothetical protein
MFKASVLAIVVAIGTLAFAGSADAQRRPATNGAGFVPNGWCKGNGNPHAAQCPIFAPGSTAPNNYNSNQPVPTTNQLPQPPQQPTVPVIQVVPLPQHTITGIAPYMVPPQPPQQLTPPVPHMAVPQPQPYNVPPLKPGFVAYPDHVGPRDPNTGYPIPPQPPAQQVPPLPQMAVPQPQPNNVPPLKPGFVAYPNYLGPRDPNTGYPIPPQPPAQQVPPLPQMAVPQPQPYNVPTPMQVDVPRPRPLAPQGNPPPTGQATVSVTPQGGGSHVGVDLITAKSGRQAPNAVPVFDAQGTGDRWHCVASGHHVRKVFDDNGNQVYAGALPGVAIQVVPIIRDVPAWHDLSSECIISVREHPKATQARR